MQKTYTLDQRWMACILLVSLLLQSCDHVSNPPLSIETQGPDKQVLLSEDSVYKKDEEGALLSQPGSIRTRKYILNRI
jgi:hypothetical protein